MSWSEVSARLGRNDMPYALAMAVLVNGEMTDADDIAQGVTDAWCSAEWPAQALDASIWWNLFDHAVASPCDYLHDGVARDREELPGPEVTLYRGAIEDHRYGMSWTDNLERATWFANRFNGMSGGAVGKVWQVTVDADVILARFQERRGEDEFVLDPHLIEDYAVEEYVA